MQTYPVHPVYPNSKPILVDDKRNSLTPKTNELINNLELLLRDLTIINHVFNQFDCDTWLDKYKNKHKIGDIVLHDIRQSVIQRKKDIITARNELKAFTNFENDVSVIIKGFKDFAVHLRKLSSNQRRHQFNSFRKIRRNDIFELLSIKSNLISTEIFLNNQSETEEHLYPRTWATGHILQGCYERVSDGPKCNQYLLNSLFEKCLVVIVSPAQNQKLRRLQRPKVFINPEISYKEAGITLVRVKDTIDVPWQWNKIFDRYNLEQPIITLPLFDNIITIDQLKYT